MERYDDLKLKSSTGLRSPRRGLNLYPEYYKKAIGTFCSNLYLKLSGEWTNKYDPERKYITKEFILAYNETYMSYPKKTRGVKFFLNVILPFLLGFLVFSYLIIWKCICKCCICGICFGKNKSSEENT